MLTNIEKYNIHLFQAINSLAGKNISFDTFFIISAEYLPYLFILLLIYLWVSQKNIAMRNVVLFTVYAVVSGMFFNFIITIFYFHPRPFMNDLGVQLIRHIPDASFPSDHATFMFSIAIMLIFFKKTRIIGIIATGVALLGGLARIVCGVHFPFDILGSFIVAICVSIILFLSKNRLQPFNDYIIRIWNQNSLREKLEFIRDDLKYRIQFYKFVMKDRRTPKLSKILLFIAVGYALMPFDIIPDFIPVLGVLDDLIIIPFLIIIAIKLVPKNVINDCRCLVIIDKDTNFCEKNI